MRLQSGEASKGVPSGTPLLSIAALAQTRENSQKVLWLLLNPVRHRSIMLVGFSFCPGFMNIR